MRWILPLLMALPAAFAAASSSSSAASADDSSNTAGTSSSKGIVPFLQTMQAAQVASMSCLITLVNMTQTPIGTCLGINKLAPLLIPGGTTGANASADFSAGLDGYLAQVCKGTQCTADEISTAQAELGRDCQGQSGGGLIPAVQAMLTNYGSSYKTLACSIFYNGTQDNCVTEAISSNKAANSPTFFMDLVSGNNLQQYTDTVFKSAKCSGCMHELYKAAVFLIPNTRSQSITSELGNHLKNDCGGGDTPNWSNVMDQQIPDALTVKQNTAAGGGQVTGAARVHGTAGMGEVVRAGMVVLVGLGLVGVGL